MLLLSTAHLAHAAIVEQSYSFTAQFSFEIIRNGGIMSAPDLTNWELASSKFFANLYADLDLEYPMLAPGVVMEIASQERYVASQPNFGSPNYGVKLQVEVKVTFQSEEFANHNVGFLALRLFDVDEKENFIYFPSYLATLRASTSDTSGTFSSISKMLLDVSASRAIDLQNPIPTLPLPPPTEPPTISPSKNPTIKPTSASPTKIPTMAPTPNFKITTVAPTAAPSKAPSSVPTPSPTAAPTAAPTTLSPISPDETRAPTPVPTSAPSRSPTRRPTAQPVLPLETYFTTNELVLGNTIGILEGDSSMLFMDVTSNYLTNYVQNVLKDTVVKQVSIDITGQSHGPRRSLRTRRLQDSKPLSVEFNTFLRVSTSSFNAQSLINGAFATSTRRENYRQLLVATGDSVLQGITSVRLPGSNANDNGDTINNIEQAPDQSPSGLGTAALVGISVGVSFIVLAVVAMWYQSTQKASSTAQQKNLPHTGQLSQEEVQPRGRLDAEIVFDRSGDDVSTLGDPVFFGTTLEEQTCADKTVSSASIKQSYDFQNLLGKGKLLESNAENVDETASKATRNVLFSEDDDSFEQVFGETR
jgi:hypothetical protein